MAKSFPHKLGTSRAGDGTRLWLEGQRLADHGFTHGSTFERKWSDGRLVLRVVDAAAFAKLARSDRGTVAGSPARPIIDIVGARVAEAFPQGMVTATYSQGRIVVAAS